MQRLPLAATRQTQAVLDHALHDQARQPLHLTWVAERMGADTTQQAEQLGERLVRGATQIDRLRGARAAGPDLLIEPPEGKKEGEWIEAKIIDHVTVRTSEREDERYKVRLKLKVEDVEKKVLVTLNDREKMKYPVLLGRNFLRDDFLVNVALDTGLG